MLVVHGIQRHFWEHLSAAEARYRKYYDPWDERAFPYRSFRISSTIKLEPGMRINPAEVRWDIIPFLYYTIWFEEEVEVFLDIQSTGNVQAYSSSTTLKALRKCVRKAWGPHHSSQDAEEYPRIWINGYGTIVKVTTSLASHSDWENEYKLRPYVTSPVYFYDIEKRDYFRLYECLGITGDRCGYVAWDAEREMESMCQFDMVMSGDNMLT